MSRRPATRTTGAPPPKGSRPVADPLVIAVTERRRRQLSSAESAAIDASDGFWRLAEAGYVSYRRAGAAHREIVGHKFVGRARAGDVEFQVREKVPGTLEALIGAATGTELRIELEDSPATDFDAISRHLMGEFTKAAGRYIADRRQPRYSYHRAEGPILAGSLDMAATIRAHATGFPGRFVFQRGRVVRDEPIDRLVLAALDELDRAAAGLGLHQRTLYDARWLAAALDEVRDQQFLGTPVEAFLATADLIERDPVAARADADLARLAAVALLHRGFAPELPGEGEVPRAWFLDLETLFEQAVREALRELLANHTVDRGENYERRMFTGGTDASRTNPDVVVHHMDVVNAVGDVKYKSLAAGLSGEDDDEGLPVQRRKKEGRPDLYQLLIHAASLSSSRAFLVYAGDSEYRSRYLGLSSTGCRTWTVQVRPTHLYEDLDRFLLESQAIEG